MLWDRERWNTTIFNIYQKMITLRKSQIALRRGNFEVLYTYRQLIAYKRTYSDNEVIIIINLEKESHKANVKTNSKKIEWLNFQTNEIIKSNDATINISANPLSYEIIIGA